MDIIKRMQEESVNIEGQDGVEYVALTLDDAIKVGIEIKEHYESKKSVDLGGVGGSSLKELELHKKIYKEKERKAHKVKDHRQAYEENIRLGIIEHLIALINNR